MMTLTPGKGVRREDLAQPIPVDPQTLAREIAELRELAATNPGLAAEERTAWDELVALVGETQAARHVYEAKGWL